MTYLYILTISTSFCFNLTLLINGQSLASRLPYGFQVMLFIKNG